MRLHHRRTDAVKQSILSIYRDDFNQRSPILVTGSSGMIMLEEAGYGFVVQDSHFSGTWEPSTQGNTLRVVLPHDSHTRGSSFRVTGL